jgi:hypothetical protein
MTFQLGGWDKRLLQFAVSVSMLGGGGRSYRRYTQHQ